MSTLYFLGEITVSCMDRPIYDLVFGTLPDVRVVGNPDPHWKRPDGRSLSLVKSISKELVYPSKNVLMSAVAQATPSNIKHAKALVISTTDTERE